MKRIAMWGILVITLSLLTAILGWVLTAPDHLLEPTEQSNELRLSEADNGSQIELTEGQVLTLNLSSNLSTGYRWMLTDTNLPTLKLVEETFSSPKDLIGAPAEHTLRFVPVAAGQTTLLLTYRRSWEKDIEPLRTYSLQVNTIGLFTTPLPISSTPTPPPAPPVQDTTGTNKVFYLADLFSPNLPTSYNWCDLGGCTPIRNQASCGSCWAFSTVGVLESKILIEDGVARDLSEQYLVSCNTNGWSCDGGFYAHDYHWWRIPPGEPDAGAVNEGDFPYQALDVACNPPHTHHEKIYSWSYIGSGIPSVDEIKQAIYTHGPVGASICAGPVFGDYESGVYQTDESSECNGGTNHAIVLVGWDDSQGIWYLRNSWGTWWGENGYMRIKWGTSNVGRNANYVEYSSNPPTQTPTPTPTATPSNFCQPAETLSCGGSDTGNNSAAGSTDQIDIYSCSSWYESGPEYAYQFVPNVSGQVTISLSNMAADLDIFVLNNASGNCNGNNCVVVGDTSASFNAIAGQTYYLVVDGYNSAVSNYTISASCPTPPTNTPTATSTSTQTETPTPTGTQTPTPTGTQTTIPIDTQTPTPTASQTPTPTGTQTSEPIDTLTPTPTSTTTPAAEQARVVSAFTADESWNTKTTFNPGDTILWVLEVENLTGADQPVELTYDVRGPNNEAVAYWNGTLTTGAGTEYWGLPGTIPVDLGGTHTFYGEGSYQGYLSQVFTTYFVTGSEYTPTPTPTATPTPTPTSTVTHTPLAPNNGSTIFLPLIRK